ncbi:MAG: ECF transporter S component [Clostridiales bacterium]|nr:ECF transporter S component [Clostridiales bacterium]
MENLNVKSNTLKLAKMALLTAIAFICSFVHFPLLFAFPFLEYELSSIPLLIAGFVFGPIRGMIIAVVVVGLRVVTGTAPNVPYGPIMNIIAACVLVLVSAAIYQKFKTKKWGLIALIVGGLCATAAMVPANLIFTPLFMGAPLEAVKELILPAIIPFNLLKAAINTVVVFLLYKRLSPFLHKW